MNKILYILVIVLLSWPVSAQEVIFADYFDIKTNSSANEPVNGKIHLKRNKDALSYPVPESYYFEITHDPSGLFKIKNIRDKVGQMNGLLTGELSVKKDKNTPHSTVSHQLTIALKENKQTLAEKTITIHVVEKTMWDYLTEYYNVETIQNSRLYGRTTFSDQQVKALIDEIESNNGAMPSVSPIYNTPIKQVQKIDDEWEKVANYIGGLGYAYANKKSEWYYTPELYRAISKAAVRYMNAVPIFGNEIDNPIGNKIGDGFQGLGENRILSHGFVTHQWRLVDGLGVPLVHIMPALRKDIESGQPDAVALQEAIYRFYQAFFSITPGRQAMNDNTQRWRNISDTLYSEGAWSDANTSHRMRSLMVMGIIWNDYNRPVTYVPYWYDDYYKGTQFEGLSFAKGWSPRGIIQDIRFWCSRLSVPSHMYDQSGFHPDGTVSHHTGHNASDVALFAYGFEWMAEINKAIAYFQNTPFPIENSQYQFLADRINYTYRRLIYKQHLDYVVAGRSHYSDMKKFATEKLGETIDQLINGKSPSTVINNEEALIELNKTIQNNTHKHSESIAFWNADYLVHRRENEKGNFYFSVKQKSVRTSGAEDFSKIRKSWHAGSGIFQLKTDGDEYAFPVLQAYDWHVLPGVTEEWRTDPMPRGPASEAGPGLNPYSGVLANGHAATSAFHYLPTPGGNHNKLAQYASATAYKSTHLTDNMGVALGSGISRKDAGQGKPIVTCIDQSIQSDILYYSVNSEKPTALKPGTNQDLTVTLNGPTWVFHKNKGYLIIPRKEQNLFIKSGKKINTTDTKAKSGNNYILALDHGIQPDQSSLNSYHYVMVANAVLKDMPDILKRYQSIYTTFIDEAKVHGIYRTSDKMAQLAFFEPGKVVLDKKKNDWIEVNRPLVLIKEETADSLSLSVCDPLLDLKTQSVQIKLPVKLKEGTYAYCFKGIETINGETAEVTATEEGSQIIVYLPDENNGAKYNFREQLLAGAPITLIIPKK